jgi:hypothetical protein
MRSAILLVPAITFVVGLHAACAPAPVTACSARPSSSSFSPVVATSSAAPTASVAASAAPPAPPPPAAAPQPPPPAFVQATAAAKQAIAAGDYPGADHQIDAAAAVAGDDPHLRFLVAYFRATRFAYAGDFESAAAAFVSVIPDLARHPETSDEFWAHNAMMMIREAQSDPAAALAENDQATLAAARGTWEPEDRDTLGYLKDRWHRAYLSRMLAQTRIGSIRKALVGYAEAALADYTARARQLGSNDESIAVLEAYFAALDGNRDAALQAARKVDPAKDDDLEDLYLVVIGLEAGGDHAAAEALRQRMRQPGSVYLARPIMLLWLEHDSKWPRDRTFTPWHP